MGVDTRLDADHHRLHAASGARDLVELCQLALVIEDDVRDLVVHAQLDEIARAAGRVQPVMIRVKPGVDAHTHEFIATSVELR